MKYKYDYVHLNLHARVANAYKEYCDETGIKRIKTLSRIVEDWLVSEGVILPPVLPKINEKEFKDNLGFDINKEIK